MAPLSNPSRLCFSFVFFRVKARNIKKKCAYFSSRLRFDETLMRTTTTTRAAKERVVWADEGMVRRRRHRHLHFMQRFKKPLTSPPPFFLFLP